MRLIIDTTTDTGLWEWKLADDSPFQPHMIRVAAILEHAQRGVADRMCRLIAAGPGWPAITPRNALVTGIDEIEREALGCPLGAALTRIAVMAAQATTVVAHNMQFHKRVLRRAFADGPQPQIPFPFEGMEQLCTMLASTDLVKLRLPSHTRYKWPSLSEAYQHFTRMGLHLPADPIKQGEARVDAVRAIYHEIIQSAPLPAA